MKRRLEAKAGEEPAPLTEEREKIDVRSARSEGRFLRGAQVAKCQYIFREVISFRALFQHKTFETSPDSMRPREGVPQDARSRQPAHSENNYFTGLYRLKFSSDKKFLGIKSVRGVILG